MVAVEAHTGCFLCEVAAARRQRPLSPALCGRCGGPAGPEGAWCDDCIRECRKYTAWLDSGARS
jgi:hypothetical protein